MFDLRQLRYAIAAADHDSFYRAARSLNIEQSTLSRNILKLERSVGMPIFERSRAGVTLTLAGSAFIRGAKPMVATADKLVAIRPPVGLRRQTPHPDEPSKPRDDSERSRQQQRGECRLRVCDRSALS